MSKNNKGTRETEMALLAQKYLAIWVKNPKISRADAVKKLQEQGVSITSVSDISRIAGSDEFRRMQTEFMELSRTQIIQSLASKIPAVIEHQFAIATGEIGYAKDSVGAARVLADMWKSIGESLDNLEQEGKDRAVNALQINNYYGGVVEDEAGPKIITEKADFDPDMIKRSYIDQSTIVDVEPLED